MIRILEKMCADNNFDESIALELIKQVDVNDEFEYSHYGLKTTLLEKAASNSNLKMTILLLNNGADPNKIFNKEECTLWNLQYNDGETVEENEQRLKIAQLLLERGANPNIIPEKNGESLFEWVLYTIFNDSIDDLWGYRSRFFILLVAYGGKTTYCEPEVIKDFDKSDMRQYYFCLMPEANGKYSGEIRDKNKDTIAYI